MLHGRAPVKPRPRRAQFKTYAAPTAGWISNRNLSSPHAEANAQGAVILDNYFPTPSRAILRRGAAVHIALGAEDQPVQSLFKYNVGTNKKMFAATPTAIYDASIAVSGQSLLGDPDTDVVLGDPDTDMQLGVDLSDLIIEMDGLADGNWITQQFATTGGIYLIGVNGVDPGFLYDGTNFYPLTPTGVWLLEYDAEVTPFVDGETIVGGTSGTQATVVKAVPGSAGTGALWVTDIQGAFEDNETIGGDEGGEATVDGVISDIPLAPGITFPNGLTTADLIYVWAYKNRLFFIEKNSLNAWYLPVDQIGGELDVFPFGGIFGLGGTLLYGASWSLDSGQSGGLSEQCIFTTTEGEVSVFQGNNPSAAENWSKVGTYRIGSPLGNKAWIRAGADLLTGTTIGMTPLSQAIQRDYAALAQASVSYPIDEAWREATQQRGRTGWVCEIWPESQMVIVAPPKPDEMDAVLFVANAVTGAWCRFTGWHVLSMCVFEGQLYFGSTEGRVFAANVSGSDNGQTYTGTYVPLFEDMGEPASQKIGQQARISIRSAIPIVEQVFMLSDYSQEVPSPPAATIPQGGVAIWGDPATEWGTAEWASEYNNLGKVQENWRSIGGMGWTVTPGFQATSGSTQPLDIEIVRMDLTYELTGF